MRWRILLLVLTVVAATVVTNAQYQRLTFEERPMGRDSLEIREGIVSQRAQRIKYKRNGKTIAIIELSEPVMVSQADEPYRWGFYQFPALSKSKDGTFIVKWSMKEDSYTAYGKEGRGKNSMKSRNNGRTWTDYHDEYRDEFLTYNLKRKNGDILVFRGKSSVDVSKLSGFPKPVATKQSYGTSYEFYPVDKLPSELQGPSVYYQTATTGKGITKLSKVIETGNHHFANSNMMSVTWWGDTKELPDGSILTCTYNNFYKDNGGKILPSAITFYRSVDNGATWVYQSHIPYQPDLEADPKGDQREVFGFTEPAIEVLDNGDIICVMRSSEQNNLGPLYESISWDKGKTWSKPQPVSPNGVQPRLLKLKNGVLVLASGRPGVQVRFSLDGSGREWTNPIDMLPFMNANGTYTRDVSCGYASLLESGKDSFYMVYSDFTTKNNEGEVRKCIWLREIKVKSMQSIDYPSNRVKLS